MKNIQISRYPIIDAYDALSKIPKIQPDYKDDTRDYEEFQEYIKQKKNSPNKTKLFTNRRKLAPLKPAQNASDYCDIVCPQPDHYHILCQNPNLTISSKCGEHPFVVKNTQLTDTEIQSIVDIHNRYRSYLSNGVHFNYSKAFQMKEIVWNSELAKIAQAWALQCENEADSCPFLVNMKVYSNIGQIQSNIRHAVSLIVQNWFSGIEFASIKTRLDLKHPSMKSIQKGLSPQTEFIGCGVMEQSYQYYVPLVKLYCNYAPIASTRKLGRVLLGKQSNRKLRLHVNCPEGYKRNSIGLCARIVEKPTSTERQNIIKQIIPWFISEF